MAVRIKFEMVVPAFETVEQAQEYVAAWDEVHSGSEDAILPKYVKGSDLLSLYFNAEWPQLYMHEGEYSTGIEVETITVDELEQA